MSNPQEQPQSNEGNTPLQTVSNEELTQEQKDLLAQTKIQQNIEGDRNANTYNNNLTTLKRIVAQASPIYERTEKSKESVDADGNKVQIPYTEETVVDYNYYSVDGKDIDTWIQETFGGKITLDKKTATINYAEGVDSGGVPQSQPQPQPQTGTEGSTTTPTEPQPEPQPQEGGGEPPQ